MKIVTSLALSLVLVLSTFIAPVQSAQPQPAGSSVNPAELKPSYTDAEWKTFAKTVISVDGIAQQYVPKIAGAKEPAEVEKLKHEANGEMMSEVEKHGLSAEQYQQMHQLLRKDPALLEKVKAYLQ